MGEGERGDAPIFLPEQDLVVGEYPKPFLTRPSAIVVFPLPASPGKR
jgi:hypothetical protein